MDGKGCPETLDGTSRDVSLARLLTNLRRWLLPSADTLPKRNVMAACNCDGATSLSLKRVLDEAHAKHIGDVGSAPDVGSGEVLNAQGRQCIAAASLIVDHISVAMPSQR